MMKKLRYTRQGKTVCIALQGLLAGLIVFVLLSWHSFGDGKIDFSELGQSFENTEIFLQKLQDILENKIRADKNSELFEAGGTYAPEKWVDIRQYASGTLDPSSRNPGTSYRIADLIVFAEGDAENMLSIIREIQNVNLSEEETDDRISAEASVYETILPESGNRLAAYAGIGSGGGITLLSCYEDLCESALDIAQRYAMYSETSSDEMGAAPSNLLYYVENTSTKQRYSNFGARTMSQAISGLENREDMTFLFQGERKSAIMVVDTEHILNEKTSLWFSRNAVLGSNEKIVMAVDLSFSLGDELQEAFMDYNARAPWIRRSMVFLILFAVLLVLFLAESILTTGKDAQKAAVHLLRMDRIPTELGLGLGFIVMMIMALIFRRQVSTGLAESAGTLYAGCLMGAAYYLFALGFLLSFVRRAQAHTLWKDSVTYYVILGSRQVLSARKSTHRLFITYVMFLVLNLIFFMIGGLPGGLMLLSINLAALLSLMRESVGNENIREGLQQIQAGRLDYRVNTEVLYGESRELGKAVNEMGEGLQKAVDSMLQSERLKAELITNVSHDLKTPLTSIINYVDLLKRQEAGSEKSAEYLHILDQKTQRLKALVTDLIEISKISSGNVELHVMEIDLRAFLMQVVGEFEDRFAEKQLEVKLETGGADQVIVMLDGERLFRIVENLMGNIAKYAAAGSAVLIQLVCEDGYAAVTFINRPDKPIRSSADELMERFSRDDASRSTEGSGLGLSIARSLTEYMGGTFMLEVEQERFAACMRFPLHAA